MVADTRRDELTKFCWRRLVAKRPVAARICRREAGSSHPVRYFCAAPYCDCHLFSPSGDADSVSRNGDK